MRLLRRSLIPLVVLASAACASVPDYPGIPRTAAFEVAPHVVRSEAVLQAGDGVDLYTQAWRPSAGQPRAVLVVVHGLKDHSDRYAELATHLVSAGYAVHALDLRGHAHSGGERVWVDRFDRYVDDLSTVVDAVRAKEPGLPVFVYGHSMGGAISTLYALRAQEGLAGLILSAAALKPGKDVSGFLVAVSGVMSAVAPRAKVLENDPEKFSRDPQVVAQMRADPLIHQPNGPARTGAELLGAMDRIGRAAPRLSVPVLALHGDADQITNPDGSRELIEKVGSKDKRLILYPGLAHDLAHEPEKQRVFADVRAWLDARTAQPAP